MPTTFISSIQQKDVEGVNDMIHPHFQREGALPHPLLNLPTCLLGHTCTIDQKLTSNSKELYSILFRCEDVSQFACGY